LFTLVYFDSINGSFEQIQAYKRQLADHNGTNQEIPIATTAKLWSAVKGDLMDAGDEAGKIKSSECDRGPSRKAEGGASLSIANLGTK
jgi:hypothetical protein